MSYDAETRYRYHDQPAMTPTRFSVTNNLIRQRGQRMKCITVSVLGFIICCILLAYIVFGDKDVLRKPVIKVAYVVFRHGDRNPTESYPLDPYNDLKYWHGGWGALTNKGKLQMYNLGKFLRSKYQDVLGETYSSDRLLVRSSSNDRCLMSAGAFLAGFQPPADSEIWLPDFNWQPIPIHSTPRSLDQLIVVKKKCPSYDKELQEYRSEEVSKVDAEHSDLYKYLSTNTGQNISSVLDVEFLFNTLEIEEMKGLQLPDWTKSVYPDPMKKIATFSLGVFTHSLQMKRLMAGPLLDDIKSKMSANSKNALESKPQVFLISGHDVNVINIMRALGYDDAPKPEIGAAVLFELHAGPPGLGDTTDYVKLFYMNSSSTTDPVPLLLPGCNALCSLDEFISFISPVAITMDEWESECNSS